MDIQRNSRLIASASSHHLDIVESGLAVVSTDWNLTHVSSPYSRLYILLDGEARIRHNQRDIPLKTGAAYLIPAQMPFDYACDDRMTQLFFHVNLYAADGHDLLAGLQESYVLPFHDRDRAAVLAAFRGNTLGDAFQLKLMVQALVTRFLLASPLASEPIRDPSPFLARVYALARQTCDAHTTVKGMAATLSLSPGALSRRFKAETGMPLGQYLDGLLLQKAQRLLLSTEESIGRISEQLGFCDQFYFSRYFKQRRQETPSRYRQRLRIGL